MTVQTKQVQRRSVRFQSIDDLRAEARRLAHADQTDGLTRLGNWTLGQALNHLATWINFAYEGFPSGAKPPLFIRVALRFMRKKMLDGGLPAGVNIPKVEGGTYGVEVVSTQEGLARLEHALERLETEPARHPSPAFGAMTKDESIKLNLRHAELHLGFFEG